MTSQPVTIRISDVTKLEERELRDKLDPDVVSFEEEEQGEDTHGEIATATAIVIVSLAALRVLAIYLVKTRDRDRRTKRVEVTKPDGTRRVVEIVIDTSSSKEPEADVLKQLAEATDVKASELATK
jgi:hypothetical protein